MMDRSDECVCCQEIPEMLSLNEEVMIIKKIKDPLTCITDNPAFTAVRLNMFVLQPAWYQYRQEYENPFIGNLHDLVGGGGVARKACSSCPAILCCQLHQSSFPTFWT